MRNFLDGIPTDAFDPENDDTIEMVLNESAMQMLSQAAAPTEQPCPGPNPALKAPELPALPEVKGLPKASAIPDLRIIPKAEVIPQVGANPETAALPAMPSAPGAPAIPEVRSTPVLQATAGAPPPRAPRPAMSTPRLLLLLTSVAVASALVTAVTYFAMTRPGRPAPVATSVVSIPPVPVTVAPSPPPPPPPAALQPPSEP
jgi:hypothetical protein